MARILRSVLVGVGAGIAGLVLSLVCLQLYAAYALPHPAGMGAVAGGFVLALPAAVLLFLIGFAWKWRLEGKSR